MNEDKKAQMRLTRKEKRQGLEKSYLVQMRRGTRILFADCQFEDFQPEIRGEQRLMLSTTLSSIKKIIKIQGVSHQITRKKTLPFDFKLS